MERPRHQGAPRAPVARTLSGAWRPPALPPAKEQRALPSPPAPRALPPGRGDASFAPDAVADAPRIDAIPNGTPRRRPFHSFVVTALGWFGRGLLFIGSLCFLFAAFQVWGTDTLEARAQGALKEEFDDRVSAADGALPERDLSTVPPMTETTETTEPPAPAPPPPVQEGDAVALLRIPSIDVDHAVVEGVGVPDLRRGPGHYPSTPLPGRRGNAAVAGHRTTYGAPFSRLNQLEPGDHIEVTTPEGEFSYVVRERLVVSPDEVGVLAATETPTLTLTTCHPRYSARQRLVIRSELEGSPADTLRPPTEPASPVATAAPQPPTEDRSTTSTARLRNSLAEVEMASASASASPLAVGRGAALPGIVGLLWWLGYRTRRRWWSWTLGAAAFVPSLLPFFLALEHALPANF